MISIENTASGRGRRFTAAATLIAAGAIAVGALGAAAPAGAVADSWVSLSYSLSSGKAGVGITADESSANSTSLQNCVANGGNQCVTYVNAKNACAAIAVGGQGPDEYSTATSVDLQTARSQALANNGAGSRLAVSGCASGVSIDPPPAPPAPPAPPSPPPVPPAPQPAPPVTDDYDHDGLSKHDELFVFHTNPFLADTDFDGVDDGDEVSRGTNPRNPLSH